MLKKTLEYRYVMTVCSHQNQSSKAAKRAISALALFQKHLDIYMKRDSQFFAILCNTCVCPYMEYCVQAWALL